MLTRILSGICLAIITISSILIGNVYLFGVCLFISLVGLMELYRIVGIHKKAMGIIGYIAVVGYYLCIYFDFDIYLMLIITAALMLIMATYVISFPKYNAEHAMTAVFGLIYICVTLAYIYEVRELENGIYIVWLIFVSSWGNDTFAYFSGVLLGKHKMAPQLSPKKSIEGAIGGVVGAAVLGAAYGAIISDKLTIVSNPILMFAIASAVGALFAIIGDLAASAIKRNYDIKDYGKLIPGHGGILDRYDSVIFTAPVVYWVVVFLSRM